MLQPIKADLYVLVGVTEKCRKSICIATNKDKIIERYNNEYNYDMYDVEMYMLKGDEYVFESITSVERLKRGETKNEQHND